MLELEYRTLFEESSNPVLLLHAETRIVLAANDAACTHFGYSREELVGRDAALLRPDEEREEMRQTYHTAPSGQPALRHSTRTWQHVRKDGTIMHVEIWRLAVKYEGRAAVLAIIHDVTERLTFERALRESEDRYRRLFEAAPVPIFVFDVEKGAYLAANEAAVLKYGWSREELLRMTVFDIRPPEDVPRLRETFAHLDGDSAENAGLWRHKTRSGQTMDVEITTQAIEFAGRRARLAIINDITERRRLEEQLRQSYKMEATGLLAGGVAHDFNNLLGIILSAVELAQRGSAAGRSIDALMGDIREAAVRAGALTRKLLAFSRKQVLHVRSIDLREAIEEFVPILRRVLGEDVQLTVRRAPERLMVQADVSQLEQILLNLCTNARHAMTTGGEVTIETLRTRIGAAQALREAWAKPGDYGEVRVGDTGCGMDARTRERIFEPFFTTKTEGTGLGLAIVHGIVHQHHGLLHVESDPGRGTTVHVLFPLVESAPAVTLPPSASMKSEPRAGGEVLLVAEDEPSLRRVLVSALKELGYEVLAAQDGAEAIQLFEKAQGRIAMALLDVVMPTLGGVQAYERMRALDPTLKVLFTTGYAPENTQLGTIVAQGGHAVLTKPFSIDELGRRVRAMLDERKGQ